MKRLDRRSLLASIGTGFAAAIAGCSDTLGADDDRREFGPEERKVVLSAARPAVERPAPVHPSETAFDAALDRLDELLERVPAPLEADHVPNEAVRHEIARAREIAVTRRERLSDASDPFHAARAAVPARRYAGEAAGAYRAVDGELTRDRVVADRDDRRARVSERAASIEYVGDDRQRTLLLTHHLESDLAAGGRWIENQPREQTAPELEIGELAGVVEYADATLAFVDDLAQRHAERLDYGRSFESTFSDALDRSLDAIDDADVPEWEPDPSAHVDADISETPAARLVVEGKASIHRAKDRTADAAETGRTSTALRAACEFERDVRAFETVREDVEDGSYRSIEEIEAVRRVREAAIERAEEVPFDPSEPTLGGDLVADAYQRIEAEDVRIERNVDRDYSSDMVTEYRTYAWIAAQLAALPDAVAAIEDRLG